MTFSSIAGKIMLYGAAGVAVAGIASHSYAFYEFEIRRPLAKNKIQLAEVPGKVITSIPQIIFTGAVMQPLYGFFMVVVFPFGILMRMIFKDGF